MLTRSSGWLRWPSAAQVAVQRALGGLEFDEGEWADGRALFEEGASRAAMQD